MLKEQALIRPLQEFLNGSIGNSVIDIPAATCKLLIDAAGEVTIKEDSHVAVVTHACTSILRHLSDMRVEPGPSTMAKFAVCKDRLALYHAVAAVIKPRASTLAPNVPFLAAIFAALGSHIAVESVADDADEKELRGCFSRALSDSALYDDAVKCLEQKDGQGVASTLEAIVEMHAYYSGYLERATTTLAATVHAYYAKKKTEAFHEPLEQAEKVQGGMINGGVWSDDLAPDAPVPVLIEHLKATIFSKPNKGISTAMHTAKNRLTDELKAFTIVANGIGKGGAWGEDRKLYDTVVKNIEHTLAECMVGQIVKNKELIDSKKKDEILKEQATHHSRGIDQQLLFKPLWKEASRLLLV